jgi:nucleotide-binding universal stress UspA family protein
MYTRILVPLENSPYDNAIIAHVRTLAKFTGASLVLIHVADGWAARNLSALQLRESEEIRRDREYLDGVCADLNTAGLKTEALLASGDPAVEIADAAAREKCDLIAMATHGHRIVADVILGSVASAVRHKSLVPVLLVRGEAKGGAPGAG